MTREIRSTPASPFPATAGTGPIMESAQPVPARQIPTTELAEHRLLAGDRPQPDLATLADIRPARVHDHTALGLAILIHRHRALRVCHYARRAPHRKGHGDVVGALERLLLPVTISLAGPD